MLPTPIAVLDKSLLTFSVTVDGDLHISGTVGGVNVDQTLMLPEGDCVLLYSPDIGFYTVDRPIMWPNSQLVLM